MTAPADYIKHFTRLDRAPGQVWSEATKRRARHRPILLGKFPGGASGPGTYNRITGHAWVTGHVWITE